VSEYSKSSPKKDLQECRRLRLEWKSTNKRADANAVLLKNHWQFATQPRDGSRNRARSPRAGALSRSPSPEPPLAFPVARYMSSVTREATLDSARTSCARAVFFSSAAMTRLHERRSCALKLSKGALPSFQSKTKCCSHHETRPRHHEERVVKWCAASRPEERLRTLIRCTRSRLSVRDREITSCSTRIIRSPVAAQADQHSQEGLLHFVEGLIATSNVRKRRREPLTPVPPRSAARHINWIYQWYKPKAACKRRTDPAIYELLFVGACNSRGSRRGLRVVQAKENITACQTG